MVWKTLSGLLSMLMMGGVAEGVGVCRPGVELGVTALSCLCWPVLAVSWRNWPELAGGDWTGNIGPMETCCPGPGPPIIMLRGPRPGGDWCW